MSNIISLIYIYDNDGEDCKAKLLYREISEDTTDMKIPATIIKVFKNNEVIVSDILTELVKEDGKLFIYCRDKIPDTISIDNYKAFAEAVCEREYVVELSNIIFEKVEEEK